MVNASDIQVTQFAPLLWDSVPIGSAPAIVFSVDENGIETYKNDQLYIIRHKKDFISHMQMLPPIPLDNYQYVMKVLNRLAKQPKRDVMSMYNIFNILYYSDFEVTRLNNKSYALSKSTKMDWIRLHLKDDLPQAPFMAYMSVLEEDSFESTAWILAALRAGFLDYRRCQDPSTASAAEALERWIDKEIFERGLLYSSSRQGMPSGLEVLLSFYNILLSDEEKQEAKKNPEKVLQKVLQGTPKRGLDEDLVRAYAIAYRGYITGARAFEQQNKEALIARANEHIKRYYTNNKPYWMAYHGMKVIQNPQATDEQLFKDASEMFSLADFERTDYQRSKFGEIENALLQGYPGN